MLILSSKRTMWDAATAGASLENDNLTARFDQPPFYGWGGARSTTAKYSGKWLFQIRLDVAPIGSGLSSYAIFGASAANLITVANLPTIGIGMAGWQPNGASAANGNVRTQFNYTRNIPWGVGDIFDVAVDLDTRRGVARSIIWWRNNTQNSGWTGGGGSSIVGDVFGEPDNPPITDSFVPENGIPIVTILPIYIRCWGIRRDDALTMRLTLIPNGGVKPPHTTTYRWWDS